VVDEDELDGGGYLRTVKAEGGVVVAALVSDEPSVGRRGVRMRRGQWVQL
jgi:hypothetical protein